MPAGGFSLHASLDIQPGPGAKRERRWRYASRPPVAAQRLVLTRSGPVRCALKNPYRDGTTPIVLEPLHRMARLAALVPPPRMHLTRYHGVRGSRADQGLAAASIKSHAAVRAVGQALGRREQGL
ncbi:MAG: transposase [Steroidobacteraceae bacterium]